MSSKNILLKKNMGFLLMAILSIGIVTEVSLITYASALNYYFNCVTKNVNRDGGLAIQEAFVCYDKVFKGAQKYSNETYQNPDLANLDEIKPVVDQTSDFSTIGDEEKDKPVITPSVAEEQAESSNGNPVADDAIGKSNGNPVAVEEEKDLHPGGTGSDAKPLISWETPSAGILEKPYSEPQSQSPVEETSNTKGSPNLGASDGVYDISPFYKSFDLPFTAVIPH